MLVRGESAAYLTDGWCRIQFIGVNGGIAVCLGRAGVSAPHPSPLPRGEGTAYLQ